MYPLHQEMPPVPQFPYKSVKLQGLPIDFPDVQCIEGELLKEGQIGVYRGFSDTVPIQPRVRYLRVTGTVSYETRGTGGTRGFLVLSNITIY